MLRRFFSLLSRLRAGGEPEAHAGPLRALDDDRRVWVRVPADGAVTYRPLARTDAEKLPGRVRDLSRGGIALALDHPFPRGTLLSVEFAGRPVLVCVAHATAVGRGWVVGGTFVRQLNPEELNVAGARDERTAASDKRAWVRCASDVRAVYRLTDSPDAPWWPARVADLSPIGLGLVGRKPVAVGRTIPVRLTDPAGRGSLTLLACVVRVQTRGDGECTFGCTFVRELAAEELQELQAAGNRADRQGA